MNHCYLNDINLGLLGYVGLSSCIFRIILVWYRPAKFSLWSNNNQHKIFYKKCSIHYCDMLHRFGNNPFTALSKHSRTSNAKTMRRIRKMYTIFFVENFMLIIITSIVFALKSVPSEILAKDCKFCRPISHLNKPKNANVYRRILICIDVSYHLCKYPS